MVGLSHAKGSQLLKSLNPVVGNTVLLSIQPCGISQWGTGSKLFKCVLWRMRYSWVLISYLLFRLCFLFVCFNMLSGALVSFFKKMFFSVRGAVNTVHLLGVALFWVQVTFLIGCHFRWEQGLLWGR